MLKVLENSRRTDIFVALLALSRGRPAELAAAPPEQAVKFFDLAVKCLIKLTKALTPTLEVRPDEHARLMLRRGVGGSCTMPWSSSPQHAMCLSVKMHPVLTGLGAPL